MSAQGVVLQNARVIDPVNGVDEVRELCVTGGCIGDSGTAVEVIDLSGLWAVPGLIDMHVHLREPGEEYKETIASGCRAAAAGGFTAVACMADTSPVNDTGSVTRFVVERARGCAARVYPVGALSVGLEGKRLAEMGEMKREGAVAVSDAPKSVDDIRLMRRAMEYAASHGLPVLARCQDAGLGRGGCMNEGALSTRMGLPGIPAAAEAVMVQREIELAELTGARVHLAAISSRLGVELIRAAKARGAKITAGTTPHHITLTEEEVRGYNTNARVNPPLRSEEDRQALVAALADGTLDTIASEHSPHSVLEKENEFIAAADGISGLESALSLVLALVHSGAISPQRLVELMSVAPARILGVAGGSLAAGAVADITIIDPEKWWQFRAEQCQSRSRNTPFDGSRMQGRAVMTFVGGRRVLPE